MVVATDARPVFLLPFVAIPLAALLDNPKISLSAPAGSDLPTWVRYRLRESPRRGKLDGRPFVRIAGVV
jgi:hypothetical protein